METIISRTKNGDSGKLINTTLLPKKKNASITSIGGPGKEFWVQGKNYKNDATSRPDPANERGSWRVEVSPIKAQQENYFLNVMQVMDGDYKEKLDVTLIEETAVVGVHIGNRVVTFSKDAEQITRSFSFRIGGTAVSKIMVSDLVAGAWQIIKDGEVYISAISARTDDGILYFEGTEGSYKFLR
jgi:hypothetical protein